MKARRLPGLILLLIVLCLPLKTFAETKGIGITPALQEVILDGQAASQTFSITLVNTSDQTTDLSLSTLDFGALDESGGIAFLGRTGQETTSYGLKQWMVLEKDRLTLEPGRSQDVKVTIDNKESLAPGGHYGAVIASAVNQTQTGSDAVAVVPAASTLVLLKKTGGEAPRLELDSVKANSSWIKVPKSATIRFKNSGNTHLVPRGTVELFGPTGSLMSRGVINEDSGFVLPESFRQFQIPLQEYRQPWLPGRYKLVTTWRYDGTDQVTIETSYHWYFGTGVLYGLGVVCLIIVLILYIKRRRRPFTRGQ